MAFAAHSEPFIQFALWSGFVALGVTVLMLVQILLLRVLQLAKTRRREAFLNYWRPILAHSVMDAPARLPHLSRRDFPLFLELWNHFHESLRGVSKDGLNKVARQLGVVRYARAQLFKRRTGRRLMAAITLGHLKAREAWGDLAAVAQSDDPVLSLTVVRAMVIIDAATAAPLLLAQLEARADWPAAKIAAIFQEAGPAVLSQPLVDAVRQASPAYAPALIRYLQFAYNDQANGVAGALLRESDNDGVISACMQLITDPGELPAIRRYLTHARWHIRMQAAAALGRLGTPEDVPLLVELLSDPEWWVRYRAAQSLAALPFHQEGDLERLWAAQTDRYAKDMLRQALAERRGE